MVVALAGWINQQQEDVIDYLREEVRTLKELQPRNATTLQTVMLPVCPF